MNQVRETMSNVHFDRQEYRQLVETQLKIIRDEELRVEKGLDPAQCLWNIGWRYWRLVPTMLDIGESEQALRFLREGQVAWNRWENVRKEDERFYPELRRELYSSLAKSFYREGFMTESAEFARLCVDEARKAVEKHPDNPFSWADLASNYILPGPCEEFRDPAEALRLLDRAFSVYEGTVYEKGDVMVEFPNQGWRMRGIAHLRLGNWEESIAAMQKSTEVRSGGEWPANAWEWFVMAMDYWHLGKHNEARKWYEEAVTWMDDKNSTEHERREHEFELRLLQAEAAELLGVPNDAPTKSAQRRASQPQGGTPN
jgi:tetratricopeptide (TPR) repeat protein